MREFDAHTVFTHAGAGVEVPRGRGVNMSSMTERGRRPKPPRIDLSQAERAPDYLTESTSEVQQVIRAMARMAGVDLSAAEPTQDPSVEKKNAKAMNECRDLLARHFSIHLPDGATAKNGWKWLAIGLHAIGKYRDNDDDGDDDARAKRIRHAEPVPGGPGGW